jgi:hypothetical protein
MELCYVKIPATASGGRWMASQGRETLFASNDEYRRLASEHAQYSQRLEHLVQKRFLSDEEKIEEVRLKKLKLRLKDQMERIEQQLQHPSQGNHVA